MLTTLQNLGWPDVLDVLFLTVVSYYLYRWFRGTKALRALIGLLVLGAFYALARSWGLFLTTWVFQFLWQVLVILLLILFQNEIRQVLERVSPLDVFSRRITPETEATLGVVARTARETAARGWGALMVLRRREPLTGLVSEGMPLGAQPSVELLLSIFNPVSPAHDGAVIIDKDRLVSMGAYLALSRRDDLPHHYGTRHRAALGLAEACDALSVVVSEERGEISITDGVGLRTISQPEELEKDLALLLTPEPETSRGVWAKVRKTILSNWKAKVGAFVLVSLVWLAVAGQQNFTVGLNVPVTYWGQETGLRVGELSDRAVKVSLKGPRRRASAVRQAEVKVVVNLAGREEGDHQVALLSQNIQVPVGLEVTGVAPKVLRVILLPKEAP